MIYPLLSCYICFTKYFFLQQKLSILFICGWYPSRVLPTNGDFIQRHAEAVALKHHVTSIHIVTDPNLKINLDIKSNKINGVETHIAYLKGSKNHLKKTFLYLKAFRSLIKKSKKFDIVHLNEIFPFGIFSLYLKWFKKTPYIISEHSTIYVKNSGTKISSYQKLISKYITRKACSICPVSNFLEKELKDSGYNGNYQTIPNVVDTNLFSPIKKENTFLKIIHISSLKDDHKNIKGMLNVAKLLSERIDFFEWKFIGNNGNEYKKHLKELGIKNCSISFLEHQTHLEIARHLQKATICVSFSNYETFGIVIPEAIACGTPVITTNTGIAIDFKELPFCKVIPINNEQLLLESILNYKTLFKNIDIYNMHEFIKQQFSKKIISNKFSLLYIKSIKK